jgi:hypothetical protein
VKEVDLKPGDNPFELRARNDDGPSLEPFVTTVRYNEPPRAPPPPVVTSDEPRRDEEVAVPRRPLAFTVLSASEPRVRVLRDGSELPPVKPVKKGAALAYRMEVDLLPGPNVLHVEVSNAGGRTRSENRVITYVPPWLVRIHLTGIERLDKKGPLLSLKEEAPVGDVRLHGEVEWRRDSPTLRQMIPLRVQVNAFEQLEAPLAPARGLRRKFTALLRLNGPSNRVELRLPSR